MSINIISLIPSYKCNGRCGHCDLWKTTDDGLSIDAIGQLFLSKYTKIQNLYISGGEPFLNDIKRMMRRIKDVNSKLATVVFATNGYLTNKILDDIEYIKTIGVVPKLAISLDGRKEAHNKMRGLDTAYDKVMRTVSLLRRVCDISFVFLMTPWNIEEIPYYLDFTKQLKVSAEFCLARKSCRFGNEYNMSYRDSKYCYTDVQKEKLLNELSKADKIGSVDRIYQFTKRYFYDKHNIRCMMGYDQVIVCPNGDVRACIDDRPFNILGNINRQTFDEIVESDRRQEVLDYIIQGNCQPCTNPCDGPKYLVKD